MTKRVEYINIAEKIENFKIAKEKIKNETEMILQELQKTLEVKHDRKEAHRLTNILSCNYEVLSKIEKEIKILNAKTKTLEQE